VSVIKLTPVGLASRAALADGVEVAHSIC
jgi:hypothetical protein